MKLLKNRIFIAAVCLVLAAAIIFVGVPLVTDVDKSTDTPTTEPEPTTTEPPEPSEPPRQVPPNGYCYVSVSVPSLASGVAGHVVSGDRVSVIVTTVNEYGEQTVSVVDGLSSVEVVSVRNNTNGDVHTSEDAIPRTVTLLVTEAQALQLVTAEKSGGVYLALVGGGE